MSLSSKFSDIANIVAHKSGEPTVFIVASLSVIAWAVTGPMFGYSETWQLIVNTATSVVTFLMVFLIQNTQNRDTAAMQVKLDELIRASSAQNAFIGIENLSEEIVAQFRQQCAEAANRPADIATPASSKRQSAPVA